MLVYLLVRNVAQIKKIYSLNRDEKTKNLILDLKKINMNDIITYDNI